MTEYKHIRTDGQHRNADGKLHRSNGPSVIWEDGQRKWVWWLRGKWHRYYGPCCFLGGYGNWIIHGKRIQ